VVPDFIANTGAAAWAWWLLQGQVGTDPQDSFRRLSTEMRSKVAVLAEHWTTERIPMRQTAFSLASTNLHLLEGARIVIP
jgi:glutamate dehydrogenase (NAD(P)+)